ncbi:hypothetical protein LZ554_007457 [Drepanopeziza brunnea f. sp. 'monogermtubi']|nr:hypothetical protein LZ554_007457 [Drepanopeziza brunnea f. sp. 'monogermtubi']
MSFLKGYLKPSKKSAPETSAGVANGALSPAMEMIVPPLQSSPIFQPPRLSRPPSIYPEGDFRNESQHSVLQLKSDVMVSWLHQQQCEKRLYTQLPFEGAILKQTKDVFVCSPLGVKESALFEQVAKLNVKAAITVRTRFIDSVLNCQHLDYIPLADGLRLQVIPTLNDLHGCQKHHFAAFILQERMMVVWDDQPRNIFIRIRQIEESLMKVIWENDSSRGYLGEKKSANTSVTQLSESASTVTPGDLENAQVLERRPTKLINPVIVGATLTLLIAALGMGFRALAQEVSIDGSYTRLALLVVTPAQIFVSLFFMQIVIVNLFQIFGPISQMNMNSKFYSGIAPRRLDRDRGEILPHITIQMPVYKEGLGPVIQPTIISLKAAISTYELQGGTANIFVNDDGMQLISAEQAEARREFYEEHNIGWVARPGHGALVAGGVNQQQKEFVRKGKFKKASNMNYALMISNKVEERLLGVERTSNWQQGDELKAYYQCLAEVLEQEQGRAWAEGNIRVGDYILLIDSDTRVPEDCLLDAASEMEQSPEVGILQYSSGVMNVTNTFFENGITFFTNLIYTAICYTVANGDVSPFVGHNAFLRWSALQQVVYEDEDGYEKFWSESHVSEDFDMSLRLQEGVSLTVYDELNRWEKYAYGCNELLFHPFKQWLFKGPFTPLFRKFLFSNIRITSKITILAYIGTYYAIGAAWILTVANYLLVGWYVGYLDKYYLDSFKVYFSLIIVFSALGNVALAVLRYRLDQRNLLSSLFENFKWVFLMSLFLGGISLHVSQALLCHFFGFDMSWGATAKELDKVNFMEEIPRLIKRFKFTFVFCGLCSAGMAILATAPFVPYYWRIDSFVAIYPLGTVVISHFMLPIALNPALMTFNW